MRKIHKFALVPYSVQEMFWLVDNIDEYADFLPWCSQSRVLTRTGNKTRAELTISYSSLHKTFVTENMNHDFHHIHMRLVEGPFRALSGEWRFEELGNDGCKVVLDLEFEFANKLMDITVGSVFSHIANSLVDAFTERAREVYG